MSLESLDGVARGRDVSRELTFSPLARLMALKGRRTRRTRRIFTTLMALDLQPTRDQRAQPAIKQAARLSKGGVGRGGGGVVGAKTQRDDTHGTQL